ncbi:MAG TPA: ketoacyl-ACP synthase III [Victivallales bacterium]|nr:ketoacyl-ACP synthase III [Victivallales bacterium]
MIGIENIASYIPSDRISNYDRKEKFSISDEFIEEKIGVRKVSIRAPEEGTADLCAKAYTNLLAKQNIQPEDIDALVVVTQNPDYNIPHCSAMVHGMLGMKSSCAAFDISLGCSGFVYALSVLKSFMKQNDMKKALLFTSDPYSKIIDPEDKNTSLLFGDAAAVTLLSESPVFTPMKFSFGTTGQHYDDLICRNGKLYMNGRAVFNFTAKVVPEDIRRLMEKNNIPKEKIDLFVFHQGSKIIVDTLAKKLEIPSEKVIYNATNFGNTVSSSIPIILEQELKGSAKNILVSGFGVGLSWASTILRRTN